MENGSCEIIINSLSAHIAVLDRDGVILETNRAWKEYAAGNGMVGNPDSVGENYFSVCAAAEESGEDDGLLVAAGIRQVLAGEVREFVLYYPCHSPARHQWFNLRVLPVVAENEVRVIVVHEDVTAILQAQEELRKKDEALHQKSEKLEEVNIALNVLLEHRERGLEELEQRVAANIRELVLPYLEKIQASHKSDRERVLLDIAVANLHDIVTPFLTRLSSLHLFLTPQEIEVATLVCAGKTSQEIADIRGISVSTVSFHRKHLRRKLGLDKRGANLRSYLLSLK